MQPAGNRKIYNLFYEPGASLVAGMLMLAFEAQRGMAARAKAGDVARLGTAFRAVHRYIL